MQSILKYSLGLLGLGLIAIQLNFWNQISFDHFRVGALGCAVLVLIVWGKLDKLVLESGPAASGAGAGLIGLVLCKVNASPGGLFASLAPLFWGLGFGLLAAGFKGLKQFREEAVILTLLVVPFFLRSFFFDSVGLDIAPLTAVVGVYFLSLLGWSAVVNGEIVQVSSGMVDVTQGCSGLKAMFLLFGLSVLLVVFLPPKGGWKKPFAIVSALLIAFFVNAIRVTSLLVLLIKKDYAGFEYWHTESGALVFEVSGVLLFVAFYNFAILWEPAAKPLKSKEAV